MCETPEILRLSKNRTERTYFFNFFFFLLCLTRCTFYVQPLEMEGKNSFLHRSGDTAPVALDILQIRVKNKHTHTNMEIRIFTRTNICVCEEIEGSTQMRASARVCVCARCRVAVMREGVKNYFSLFSNRCSTSVAPQCTGPTPAYTFRTAVVLMGQ